MIVISWNCNGAFRKKYKHLIKYNYDIMIIQECENPNVGELGLKSLYHQYYNEEQGKETISTLYHRKNIEKSYHVDYILASKKFYTSLSKFEIGNPPQWLTISDHMPIFIEIKR